MSHRSDCPDPWEAEREGREDAHRRSFVDSGRFDCHEAQDSYESGFRRESWRIDEQREQERQEEAALERRRELAREEEAFWEEEQHRANEQAAWEAQQPTPTERELCEAMTGHEEYPEAADAHGRRCGCGKVRWMTEAA